MLACPANHSGIPMTKCKFCGYPNPDGRDICYKCGTALWAIPPPDPPPLTRTQPIAVPTDFILACPNCKSGRVKHSFPFLVIWVGYWLMIVLLLSLLVVGTHWLIAGLSSLIASWIGTQKIKEVRKTYTDYACEACGYHWNAT